MTHPAMRNVVTDPIDYSKKIQPCENCNGKASFKEKFGAYLCVTCVNKLENKAARDAIKALQKAWRERGKVV